MGHRAQGAAKLLILVAKQENKRSKDKRREETRGQEGDGSK